MFKHCLPTGKVVSNHVFFVVGIAVLHDPRLGLNIFFCTAHNHNIPMNKKIYCYNSFFNNFGTLSKTLLCSSKYCTFNFVVRAKELEEIDMAAKGIKYVFI